jgi:hypothetical protein
MIRMIYNKIFEETPQISVQRITEELKEELESFDETWVAFEKYYVLELMIIEADARRFITESIELEKQLTAEEAKEKSRGKIMLGSMQIEII